MKSSVGGKERGPENELVHWCHGAPGESDIFVKFFGGIWIRQPRHNYAKFR